MATQQINPSDNILSCRVATIALKIEVGRVTLFLRDTFTYILNTRLIPNIISEAPLSKVQLVGHPITEPIMLITIPPAGKNKYSHYVVLDLLSSKVGLLNYTELNMHLILPMLQTISPPLFVCASRSKLLMAIEDVVVARSRGFGFSAYAVSEFEIFDPFMEKISPIYIAVPHTDEIVRAY